MLTQEEHAVFKRGRNAKSATSAKNASVIDYRMATGMEALVGWLFLRQEYNRLVYLISQGLIRLENCRAGKMMPWMGPGRMPRL